MIARLPAAILYALVLVASAGVQAAILGYHLSSEHAAVVQLPTQPALPNRVHLHAGEVMPHSHPEPQSRSFSPGDTAASGTSEVAHLSRSHAEGWRFPLDVPHEHDGRMHTHRSPPGSETGAPAGSFSKFFLASQVVGPDLERRVPDFVEATRPFPAQVSLSTETPPPRPVA